MIAERLDDELVEAAARGVARYRGGEDNRLGSPLSGNALDFFVDETWRHHVHEARAALAAALEIVAGRVEARAEPAAPNPDGTVALEAMLQAKTNGVLKEAARIIRMEN